MKKDFRDFVNVKAKVNEETDDIEERIRKANENRINYFEIKQENGLRYDIPYLKVSDPLYYQKYCEYMKLKLENPAAFEKIMNWD